MTPAASRRASSVSLLPGTSTVGVSIAASAAIVSSSPSCTEAKSPAPTTTSASALISTRRAAWSRSRCRSLKARMRMPGFYLAGGVTRAPPAARRAAGGSGSPRRRPAPTISAATVTSAASESTSIAYGISASAIRAAKRPLAVERVDAAIPDRDMPEQVDRDPAAERHRGHRLQAARRRPRPSS